MNGFMPLIESALAYARAALVLAIYSGFWGGLLLVVPLIINLVFRRWLTPRQLVAMWGIVLLRLFLPMAPGNSFSLQELFYSSTTRLSADVVRVHKDGTLEELGSFTASELAGLDLSDTRIGMSVCKVPNPRELAEGEFEFTSSETPLFTILSVAWLALAAIYLLWTLGTYRLFVRGLERYPACTDSPLQNLWQECCAHAGIRQRVPIVVTSGELRQPAVVGVIRPKLLLPAEVHELTHEELRMIMLHELAHVRFRDTAVNWLLVLLRAFHWWNPGYWLAAARIRILQEQACDAFAIRHSPGMPARRYGELLLALVEKEPAGTPWRITLPASILGLFPAIFRKRAIASRIRALRLVSDNHNRVRSFIVAALVLLFALIGLTDALLETDLEDSPGDVASELATAK